MGQYFAHRPKQTARQLKQQSEAQEQQAAADAAMRIEYLDELTALEQEAAE